MDPSKEEVYTFLDSFLDSFLEEMTAHFPDPYFHIGGDEVEGSQWKESRSIQKFAREHQLADQAAIHGYFNQRVQAILKKYGKTMIGWDEVLQPGLAPDTVIQSWRGQAALATAAKSGYRGILSYGYYLDHLRPASYHYAIDPGDALGGEACMWNEYASSENEDSRIWPRMVAIAERFWSPRDVTSPESMYERMESVSRQLDFVGLQHHAYQDPMLSRLGPIEPLRILADAVETAPVQVRRRARKYSSLTPLNRLVDAAHPESESVRQLELAIKRGDLATLKAAFSVWSQNKVGVEELQPLSQNLAAAGIIGLEMLDYIEKNQTPRADWTARQNLALDAMNKPSAELNLAAARIVKALFDHAALKLVVN